MHSVLPLYRKPEFVRRAHLYVAAQTRSLYELPTDSQPKRNYQRQLSLVDDDNDDVETGQEVNCTLDRVGDPSGDYNCQANLRFRRPRR